MIDIMRQVCAILDNRTRRVLPWVLASFFAVAFLDVLSIGLVFPLMTAIFSTETGHSWAIFDLIGNLPGQADPVIVISISVVFLFMAKNVFAALLVRWQYRVLSAAEADVGARQLEAYLQRPWREISKRNSSEMIRNASVSTSHAFLSFIIPSINLMAEAVLLMGVLLLLVAIDALVSLSIFAFVAVAVAIYYFSVSWRLKALGAEFQAANFLMLKHLKQGIGAGREIRVANKQAYFVEELAQARKLYANAQTVRAFFTHLPRYYLETVLLLAIVVGLVVASRQTDAGGVVTLMAVFGLAAFRIAASANRMLAAAQQIRMGLAPLRAVHDDLLCKTDGKSRRVSPTKGETSGLTLQNVAFSYKPDRAALQDISVSIPWGQSIAIVGPSGSGKSTLLDVFLGLLTPDKGEILADGVAIHADISAWRSKIGFVPQTIYLMDNTLRRNVAFGVPDEEIDDEMVLQALRIAELEEFVLSLPGGLNTMLGDLGAELSGGQQQRVGIARALYHDPTVLIFDEATSALDGETEEAIVRALKEKLQDKTLIVVAHRWSTIRGCDRLVVLEAGRVTGDGDCNTLAQTHPKVKQMMIAPL